MQNVFQDSTLSCETPAAFGHGKAIGVEADCIEAIYNLGLVYKRLNFYNESLQAFEKLHTIIPNSYEVIY